MKIKLLKKLRDHYLIKHKNKETFIFSKDFEQLHVVDNYYVNDFLYFFEERMCFNMSKFKKTRKIRENEKLYKTIN